MRGILREVRADLLADVREIEGWWPRLEEMQETGRRLPAGELPRSEYVAAASAGVTIFHPGLTFAPIQVRRTGVGRLAAFEGRIPAEFGEIRRVIDQRYATSGDLLTVVFRTGLATTNERLNWLEENTDWFRRIGDDAPTTEAMIDRFHDSPVYRNWTRGVLLRPVPLRDVSSNGAHDVGVDRTGTRRRGLAPRAPGLVLRAGFGVGYDSATLLAAVVGRMGVNQVPPSRPSARRGRKGPPSGTGWGPSPRAQTTMPELGSLRGAPSLDVAQASPTSAISDDTPTRRRSPTGRPRPPGIPPEAEARASNPLGRTRDESNPHRDLRCGLSRFGRRSTAPATPPGSLRCRRFGDRPPGPWSRPRRPEDRRPFVRGARGDGGLRRPGPWRRVRPP